jgi:hypothetical protein
MRLEVSFFSFSHTPLTSFRLGHQTNNSTVPISLVTRHYQEVETQAEACQQSGDWAQWYYFQRLIQTANGRYHVRQTNLNEATQVQPLTFRGWLDNVWAAGV